MLNQVFARILSCNLRIPQQFLASSKHSLYLKITVVVVLKECFRPKYKQRFLDVLLNFSSKLEKKIRNNVPYICFLVVFRKHFNGDKYALRC